MMMKNRPSIITVVIVLGVLLLAGAGGAYAGGKIGTKDLKNNAVTTSKIKWNSVASSDIRNGAVKRADIALGAKGSPVTQYVVKHDFTASHNATVQLPGRWNPSAFAGNTWSVDLVYVQADKDVFVYPIFGWESGSGEYFTVSLVDGKAHVFVGATNHFGVAQIRVYRTVPTRTTKAKLNRVIQPQRPAAER